MLHCLAGPGGRADGLAVQSAGAGGRPLRLQQRGVGRGVQVQPGQRQQGGERGGGQPGGAGHPGHGT